MALSEISLLSAKIMKKIIPIKKRISNTVLFDLLPPAIRPWRKRCGQAGKNIKTQCHDLILLVVFSFFELELYFV